MPVAQPLSPADPPGWRAGGLLPQRVFNSYSRAYNGRYDHSGTLFEGPYKVVPLEERKHLLHLCPYIHANPVTHGLVPEPGTWAYTNYQEWIGERAGTLVDRYFVRGHFSSPAAYREFATSHLRDRHLPAALQDYLPEWDR